MIEITELDNLLNTLETSSLEPHGEYSMDFTNHEQAIIWNYIKELQQENQKLKEQCEKQRYAITENCDLRLEIEQLKEQKKIAKKSDSKKKHGQYQNVRLTEKEFQTLIECYGEEQTKQLITYLDEYIEMKGYKAKSHYLCIKKWVVEAVKEKNNKNFRQNSRIEPLPSWFNKETPGQKVSDAERKEIEELLKEYR